MAYRIVLEKENFKFSCSHFTIFGPEAAERLHGHNYYVGLEIRLSSLDPETGMAFDFNVIKPSVREITASLDEAVLVPAHSPFIGLAARDGQLHVSHANSRYEFPEGDVRVLPLVNITSEELARYVGEQLVDKLIERFQSMPTGAQIQSRIESLEVSVQETRGQTVYFLLPFNRALNQRSK